MTLYEYQCPSCENVFEKRISMEKRKSKQPCPKCETKAERREMSTFAVSVGG